MSKEIYTRDALIELRKKVVRANRDKYIDSVVTYVKEGVLHTVTDTRNNILVYNAPCSSKPMAELLMPDIRAQLKEIFPDLAVRVEHKNYYNWLRCRFFEWLVVHCIEVTVSW